MVSNTNMNNEDPYSDPVYDEIVTMSRNDRARAQHQSLEQEVLRLKEQLKEKDKVINDYEQTIVNSSIKNIPESSNDSGLTKDDLFNIMYNQSVIAIRNDSKSTL